MKDKKKFLIVFAISWIVGLTGGYMLGVGSALLPFEDIDYNYYLSENVENSDVEEIKTNSNLGEVEDSSAQDEDTQDNFYIIIKNVGVFQIPQKLIDHYLGHN